MRDEWIPLTYNISLIELAVNSSSNSFHVILHYYRISNSQIGYSLSIKLHMIKWVNRAAFFSIYPYKTYSLSIFGRIYRTTDLEISIYPTERNVRRFNEMTFLLPYRFCQCSSSLKFCVFPIFRLKQVICLTWLSKIYKVKHGQRKSLFKFYLKATCLLKLCIEVGKHVYIYICVLILYL